MIALDLFCGGGGAARGILAAGFDEIVGIDNKNHRKSYPGHFILGDALRPPVRLEDFDFVWASPPCQAFSEATRTAPIRREHVNLIPPTRDILVRGGVPFCIENVPRAPLRADVVCTGSMFGLRVIRKRVFEIEGFAPPMALDPTHGSLRITRGDLASVAGHGHGVNKRAREGPWRDAVKARNTAEGWRQAMGIEGMTRDEIAEAVPPAYAEFIAREALRQIRAATA